MCLAVPGRVREIRFESDILMGTVDFGGVKKDVCLAYVPEIKTGEYVVVHVGFAIAQVDEHSAQETLRNFQEMGLLNEEFGSAESLP